MRTFIFYLLILGLLDSLPQTSALAQESGPIRSHADWEALFTSESMRGLDREVYSGDTLSPMQPMPIAGAKVTVGKFQVRVRRANVSKAKVIRFPLPGTASPIMENGVPTYKDIGPLLKSFLSTLSGPSIVDFDAARYEFLPFPGASNEPAIWIKGKQDLVFRGTKSASGQRTEFYFRNPFADGVRITQSERIELFKIDLDFDYSLPVESMNPTGMPDNSPPTPLGATHLIGQSCGGGYLTTSELPPSQSGLIKTLASLGERTDRAGQKIFSYVNPNNSFHRFVVLQSNRTSLNRQLEPVDTPEAKAACSGLGGKFLYFSQVITGVGNDFPRGYRVLMMKTRNAQFKRRDGTVSEIPLGDAVYAMGPGVSDVTLSKLRLFHYPQMGFLFKAVDGAQVIDSQIRSKTEVGEKFSGRADGIHFSATNDILVARNWIAQQGDDGLNIHGNDLQARYFFPNPNQLDDLGYDPRGFDFELELTGEIQSAQIGDFLVLLTNTNSPLHVVRITRIGEKREHLDGETNVTVVPIAVDFGSAFAGLPLQQQKAYKDQLLQKLLLTQGPNDRIANFFNISRPGTRSVVEDNIFADNAGRGVLIQTPNALIQRNIIQNTGGAGIFATAENGVFVDGPGPINVAILNNQINETSFKVNRDQTRNAAIAVGSDDDDSSLFLQPGFSPDLANYRLPTRILIRDNKIGLSGQAGIFVSRAAIGETSSNGIVGPVNRTGRIPEGLGNFQISFPPAPEMQAVGVRNTQNWNHLP